MSSKSINQIMSELIGLGDTPIHGAILSLIFTSGLKSVVFRDFKIEDLIKACNHCFDVKENHDIVTLLNKDSHEIFCCWENEDNFMYQVTFSTPETTRYIFNYLKQEFDIVNINKDDCLFRVENKSGDFGQMRKAYVSDTIKNKVNSYNDIFKDSKSCIHLTERKIRDYFKSICEEHLDLEDDKDQLIDLFVGKATKENKFYKMYKEDKNSILDYYKQLLPYLTINSVTNDNVSLEGDVDNFDNKYFNHHSCLENNASDYRDKIRNYFDNKFQSCFGDFSEIDNARLLSNAYNQANSDIFNKNYEESDFYFEKILKRGEIITVFNKSKYYLSEWDSQFFDFSESSGEKKVEYLFKCINDLGILDKYNLDSEDVKNSIIDALIFHDCIDDPINYSTFKEILFLSIFEVLNI